jgi:uncharacterized lipoprotein YddW (UPF0748 family)
MTVPQLIDVYKTTPVNAQRLAENNFAVLNPTKVYRFDRAMYLDAGYPEVRKHIVDTVREVIENYDVDAIHFDDYFYPYSSGFGDVSTGVTPSLNFLDAATFALHGAGYADDGPGRRQWWRDNNTKMIEEVKAVIAAENLKNNRAIQFGVSPFGIWARDTTPTIPPGVGSPTGATNDTYSQGVYADTYNWVRNGLIDYMAPQIYWEFEHATAPYKPLARWWADVHEGKNVHLYVGHANYKHIHENFRHIPGWQEATQILEQLKYNQDYPLIKGSAFFSYRTITSSANVSQWDKVLIESNRLLREYWGLYKTIVPPMKWLNPIAPNAPINVNRNGNVISWEDTEANNTRYYVIYRVSTVTPGSDDAALVIQDPSKIIAKVWRNGETSSFEDNVSDPSQFTYIVTALNAAHVESDPSVAK